MKVKYSIKFYLDNTLYAEHQYEEGETIVLPTPDPVKDGYVFDGWKVGDVYITSTSTMPASDVVAYAFFVEAPEEPKTLVERLVANQVPMYAVTNDGELAEIPFNLVDADAEPTESGFYTVEDADGNIIEGGYQELTISNDEMYYIIALPKEVDYNTMVDLQSWDSDEHVWVESDLNLTSDPDTVAALCDEAGVDVSHINTDEYTIWAFEDDTCTGSILRYTIKEEA